MCVCIGRITDSAVTDPEVKTSKQSKYQMAVTLNNASDYRANGLLSDYIGWTNGLAG